jgi:excinuclease UvrABC nuclease subunit
MLHRFWQTVLFARIFATDTQTTGVDNRHEKCFRLKLSRCHAGSCYNERKESMFTMVIASSDEDLLT